MGVPIPFTDFGGVGPVCHFAHANGYPPAAYTPLIKRLSSQLHPIAMHLRPLWDGSDPNGITDWQPFADDLIEFLSASSPGPVIGIGHSIGGTTTLRVALQRPDLLRLIVLIDPVLFPPWVTTGWNIVTRFGLEYQLHPLSRGALRRKTEFESTGDMFANYRTKKVFHRMDSVALEAYVQSIARQTTNGHVQLSYSPDWEARIYVTAAAADLDLWHGLPGLQVPVLVLRGEFSNTFFSHTARLFQRRLPAAEIHTIANAGHLVPLERPEETAVLIKEFIRKHTS